MRSLARCSMMCVLVAGSAWGADLPESWQLTQLARPGWGSLPFQARFDRFEMGGVNDRGDWAIGTDHGVLVNGALLGGSGYNRSHSSVGINDVGRVVWAGSVSTGQGGIFSYDIDSGTGGFVTNGPDPRYGKYNPTVNDAGLIAYGGASNGWNSINVHDLATGESRVAVQGNGQSVRVGDRGVVNSAGQIAYFDEGQLTGLKRLEPDGTVTHLPNDGASWSSRDHLWMNDTGQVAGMPRGDHVMRTGDDGPRTLVHLPFGPGSDELRRVDLQVPVINDAGWVVFRAEVAGSKGVVAMTDGDSFAIVAGEGDTLLTDRGWGVIDSIEDVGVSMNDRGDVLLVAQVGLLDGGGIGDVLIMATVPAPGFAALAAPGLAAVARRPRRVR